MRVLFLTQNPSLVGTTRILQEWLLQGHDRGIQGAVCTTSRGDLAEWLETRAFPCAINRMRWPDRRRPWEAIWDVFRLRHWMRQVKIDIIQCNEHQIYPFAALLARFSGLPVVCHVRCLLKDGFAAWAFEKHEPDALIWCTQYMADLCQEALGGHVAAARQHVIPLGLTADGQSIASPVRDDPNAKLVVGMACFLRPGKRIEDFLEVARRFRDEPQVCFKLAGGLAQGDEEYYQTLLPKIEASVAEGVMEWNGHIEPVDRFLQEIDVFVSTSEHESFGMSVCEAMAWARPVVAYVGGAVKEVVGEAGLIVPTGDIDGLTAALKQLLQNPGLREVIGQQAKKRVISHYSPEKSFVKLESVYQSLVA